MSVFTVHAPVGDGADPSGVTDRVTFVRDGFQVWALLLGPVWLLYHRLWLALLGYLVLSVGASVALAVLPAGPGIRFAVMALIAILMGLEATSLRRWTLSRRKWRQLDIVVAANEEAAERRYFDRLARTHGVSDNDRLAIERGAPPTRDIPGQPFSRPPSSHTDIIGLFPQPGVPR